MAKRLNPNLFNTDEVIKLCEFWIKENEWKHTNIDEMDAYHNGIAAGVRFTVMLLKRTGD